MEVQAHTTTESRRALRNYLRQRRLTTSIHQTITVQTLNDLEEALHLLVGVLASPDECRDEAKSFLEKRISRPSLPSGTPLPGLMEAR